MSLCIQILVRKTEGRKHLGKSRRRWEEPTKINLKEIVSNDVEWIHLAQDRDN